jgi:DNA-binding transcriptional MerR regulator
MQSQEELDSLDYKAMKYKGTVDLYAKLLGMSKEGLRFYEQKGILNPERTGNSRYRIYGGDETTLMVLCRKYRRYSFSLNKVIHLVHQSSSRELVRLFCTQRKALENEIKEKKRILSSLKSKIRQLADIESGLGTFTVVTRPAIYWMETRKNQVILDSPQAVLKTRRWNSFSPHTDPVIVWSLEKLLNGKGDISTGHIIEKKDASGIPVDDARCLSETTCIYTVNKIQGYLNMTTSLFTETLDYMRKNNFTPTGDAVARTVHCYMDEDHNYQFLSQLWIPI